MQNFSKESIAEFKLLTVEELRQYKRYLIGQIKQLNAITRMIDKTIKDKLIRKELE